MYSLTTDWRLISRLLNTLILSFYFHYFRRFAHYDGVAMRQTLNDRMDFLEIVWSSQVYEM